MSDPPREQRIRFRIEVDEAGLVDDYLAYVTDPRATRNEHHAALLDSGPVPPAVLEQMVLDGVTEREHVAELVAFVLERGDPNGPVARYRWTE